MLIYHKPESYLAYRKLSAQEEWSSIKIHVAMDNTVIIDEVGKYSRPHKNVPFYSGIFPLMLEQLCCQKPTPDQAEEEWKPLLLVIPLRLGLVNINPIYKPGLKVSF